MSGNKHKLQERYDRLQPSPALLRRTENMMARTAEKNERRSRGYAKIAAGFTAVFTVLCLIIAGLVYTRYTPADNITPLASNPTVSPTGSGETPTTAVTQAPELEPIGTANEQNEQIPAQDAGVDFIPGDLTLDGGEFRAEWTVRSRREEPVYYIVEYRLASDSAAAESFFLHATSSTSESQGIFSEDSMLLFSLQLIELNGQRSEFSSSLSRSYEGTIPSGIHALECTVHAYLAADDPAQGVADWGSAGEETIRLLPSVLRADGSESAIRTEECARVIREAQLEENALLPPALGMQALEESGLFEKIMEQTFSLALNDPAEETSALFTAKDMQFDLPARTVYVQELRVDEGALSMSYDTHTKEGAADGAVTTPHLYVMSPEGKYLGCALVDGGGYAHDTIVWDEDGKYDYAHYDIQVELPGGDLPEYLVLAPYDYDYEYIQGTLAQKFEAVYSYCDPAECMVIPLSGDAPELPAREIPNENGVSFAMNGFSANRHGHIEAVWSAQSERDEDVYTLIEAELLPAGERWLVGGEAALGSFAEHGAILTGGAVLHSGIAQEGSLRCSYVHTEPCPGAELKLTLYAYTCENTGGIFSEDESGSLLRFADDERMLALSDAGYLRAAQDAGAPEDIRAYRKALTESGLFEEIAVLEQTVSIPAYTLPTQYVLGDIVLSDLDGRTITIHDMNVQSGSLSIHYTIDGKDLPDYMDEDVCEGLYFAVCPAFDIALPGYKTAATNHWSASISGETGTEFIPSYVDLVPYPKEITSSVLSDHAAAGTLNELLMGTYENTDEGEIIRVYTDGTDRIAGETALYPTSTLSEASTLSEPPMDTSADNILPLGDRIIEMLPGLENEEQFTMHMNVYAQESAAADWGSFAYFPVAPDGSVIEGAMHMGSDAQTDSGWLCSRQSLSIDFEGGEAPEYIILVPYAKGALALGPDEEAAAMQATLETVEADKCFVIAADAPLLPLPIDILRRSGAEVMQDGSEPEQETLSSVIHKKNTLSEPEKDDTLSEPAKDNTLSEPEKDGAKKPASAKGDTLSEPVTPSEDSKRSEPKG